MREFLEKILNFLLPPQCPFCRSIVSSYACVCGACWSKMNFISKPCCSQCARPFDYGEEAALLKCGLCLEKNPFYKMSHAAFLYDDFSKRLILSLKHGGALHLAPLIAKWMVHGAGEILKDADYLVPVPLHWTRLIKRGYNQSSVLAREVSRLAGVPVSFNGLQKVKRTASQGKFALKDRYKNVRGAFQVSRFHVEKFKGKRVVLIDDVRTTGATLNSAAGALLQAGAWEVRTLCASRVK